MDSFSSPSSGSSHQMSAQDLKSQLQSQLALEYAQQFLEDDDLIAEESSKQDLEVEE